MPTRKYMVLGQPYAPKQKCQHTNSFAKMNSSKSLAHWHKLHKRGEKQTQCEWRGK